MKLSRRRFLLSATAVAGAMVVGWGALPPRQRVRGKLPLPVSGGAVPLNGWVAIAPDNTVSVVMARSEMGQGVHTALPMLLAEELDVPLAQVKLVQAPNDKIYGNVSILVDSLPFHPDEEGRGKRLAGWLVSKLGRELGINMTGGSSSVKDLWLPMREAGATARALLIEAAAREWKVKPAECFTEAGFVAHPNGKRAAYGALVAAAAGMTPGTVRLKSVGQFRLIGTAAPRLDTPSKVNGSARFGLDARPEGMLYAAVKMSPVIGGAVASVDTAAVLKMPGVARVVDFSSALAEKTGASAGLAVVAAHYWQAKQAAAALPVTWNEGAHGKLSSEGVFKQFAQQLDDEDGHAYYTLGEVDDVAQAAGAVKTLKAEYRAPFLAHAALEPLNCTAQVKDGKVRLWVSTQAPGLAIDAAAKVAGVSAADVTLEVGMLGGGFGRRLETDFIAQAVAVAKECNGVPVQMIWSREDDTTHDVYRPAALARFAASLDAAGNIAAWDSKSVSGAIGHQFFKRNLGLPGAGPDKTTAEGAFDMQYEIPNQRVRHVTADSAVPIGYFRSVGHSHNAFFKESFIDELAHAVGQSGASFRRGLLHRHPRHLAVLNAAVDKAGQPPPGRAHGVALHQSFGTIVAQVAEVSVQDKQIIVHRVVCAVDCGIAVNPGIISQQVESAVVFGLSAALSGEITIKDGKVEQSNFHQYEVLRMPQAPKVETIIMLSAEPPEGMGEPAVPPVAPAVANAVFTLTGQRLRSLPLRLA
ncbi:xanthine dehydrogenase family protein molybdopterin-binding subunit [Pseudoduganella aquatica]|uniref:xanthine dehydrogenase family protein molybdopterin-binding subunit n=1 Tax=Pseudoduganella aquatica TaxID=2660641 RepID=UPI001E3E1C27|nr:molybdopterin cofactor-binding domain-containing protein [Pseudoduganella aquatica]